MSFQFLVFRLKIQNSQLKTACKGENVMRRRTLLKGLLVAAVAAPGFRLPLVNAADYSGKLFVLVQADGGWDPTSFCDPKTNTPGESIINRWAQRDDIRQAGNIAYAPFANNAAFFEKYHQRILVAT